MNFNPKMLTLYAVTDRKWLKENETLANAVEAAIQGGASIVQLREKELTGQALKELALSVQAVCKNYQVPFLINDDVALAKEIGADGVHVGQSDMAAAKARTLLGPDAIIGVTAKTPEQAQAAKEDGADYLGSGAIFGTSTKADAKAMSRDAFTAVCESTDLPVVAIGGIDLTNAEKLKGLPLKGIAVVSGIFAAEDVGGAARELRSIAEGLLSS